MIKIEIDGKGMEDIIRQKDDQNKYLNEMIDSLRNDLIFVNENIIDLSMKLNSLQSEIIELKTEETKERKSLWEFLKSFVKKDVDKTSRIKQSTVTLGK